MRTTRTRLVSAVCLAAILTGCVWLGMWTHRRVDSSAPAGPSLGGQIGPGPGKLTDGDNPYFDGKRVTLAEAEQLAPKGHPIVAPSTKLAEQGDEDYVWEANSMVDGVPDQDFQVTLEYASGVDIMISPCQCTRDPEADFKAQLVGAGPGGSIANVDGVTALEMQPDSDDTGANDGMVTIRKDGYYVTVTGLKSMSDLETVVASLQTIGDSSGSG